MMSAAASWGASAAVGPALAVASRGATAFTAPDSARGRREWARRRLTGRRAGELLALGTAGHGAGGELPGRDRILHRVEISRADEGLVLGGAIAGALLCKFALLELRVAVHALVAVGAGELEHRQVERVPARERDELEAIAHGGE